jgi:MOSC domain-containing protein YiiM
MHDEYLWAEGSTGRWRGATQARGGTRHVPICPHGTMAAMRWSAADVRGTAASLDQWWALLTEGIPAEVSATLRRSAPADGDVEAIQAALSELSLAGRCLQAGGYGVATQRGSLAGIFRSDGGVPKLPVPAATVDLDGVAGDRQAKRRYHGRVWQSLSLWSAEVVADLRTQGHPISPGAAGENLSLRGLDWDTLRPGVLLQIGGVLAEVSMPVTPCRQIAPCFSDGDPWRIDHKRHRGVTRWYATVLQPGEVRVGDEVVVEPASSLPVGGSADLRRSSDPHGRRTPGQDRA